MIEIRHIEKKFRKLKALDDVSASFRAGQVVALIGPNGSGKTTLIKSILGMVKPDKGEILINGQSVDVNPCYRSRVGYMPQIGRYPDNMKIRQLFHMLEEIRKVPEAETDRSLLTAFQLDTMAEKALRTLSGGTRQKVSAALAFLFNPDILILDEPTAGLDPLSAEILKTKIAAEKQKNKLIIITSHILSDLEDLATDILYMQDGKRQFYKEISTIQEETGELRLGRAIARIMKSESAGADWIDRLFHNKPSDIKGKTH